MKYFISIITAILFFACSNNANLHTVGSADNDTVTVVSSDKEQGENISNSQNNNDSDKPVNKKVEELGISFTLPSSYIQRDSVIIAKNLKGQILKKEVVFDDTLTSATINIAVHYMPFSKNLFESYKGNKSAVQTEINGLKGYKLVMEISTDGRGNRLDTPYKVETVYLMKDNGEGLSFVLRTKADNFDREEKIFKDIIQSVKF